jgi:hypothetical protein
MLVVQDVPGGLVVGPPLPGIERPRSGCRDQVYKNGGLADIAGIVRSSGL